MDRRPRRGPLINFRDRPQWGRCYPRACSAACLSVKSDADDSGLIRLSTRCRDRRRVYPHLLRCTSLSVAFSNGARRCRLIVLPNLLSTLAFYAAITVYGVQADWRKHVGAALQVLLSPAFIIAFANHYLWDFYF